MDFNPYSAADDDVRSPKRYSGASQNRLSRDPHQRYSDPQKRYSGLSYKRWSQLSNPLSKEKTQDPDQSETYRLRDFATQTSFVLGDADNSRLSWKDDDGEEGRSPDDSVTAPKDEQASPITPPKEDPNLVTWEGPNDPANPQNWGLVRKLLITSIWVYATMVAAIGSSIFASGALEVVNHFHVSPTVATLGVSLFLLVRQVLCSHGCHRHSHATIQIHPYFAFTTDDVFLASKRDMPAVHLCGALYQKYLVAKYLCS